MLSAPPLRNRILEAVVALAEVTFTGVSSVSLNGCFTGEYDNYHVSVLATGSASTDTALRLRASGTDTSTGYNLMFNYSSRTTGLDRTRIGRVNAAPACLFATDIYAPFIATATIGQSENVNGASTVSAEAYGWQQTGSTSFDGFTIYPESGTFTGTVSVYGYKS